MHCDVVDLFEMTPDLDKYLIDVELNGKPQRFEVDSGARFSLLSECDFNKLNLGVPLEKSNVCFRSYTSNIIKPIGKVSLTVTYNGKQIDGELHIVPAGHDALLGRQWI
uniref:Peptidase A2 domain-containing protein n=1 Tax=Cuerna arida TaxID=1464854 RepID=A0A1B6GVJ1_9HEMI